MKRVMNNNWITKSRLPLSKIGIGTYGIGGRAHRYVGQIEDTSEQVYIEALVYQLKKGLNFTEISNALAQGSSASILSKAISESKIKRDDLFITHSLYPKDLNTVEDIKKDLEQMYEKFNTDYFNSTLITQSLLTKFGEENIIEILNKLLQTKQTEYITVSNMGIKGLERIHNIFKDKLFAHEVHLSFEIRENQDERIIDYAKQNNIRTHIWRPLRENKTATHNWPILVELSKKYGKTQNQIILNWMISNEYFPMFFSKSIEHINENLASLDFEMEQSDIQRINSYKIEGYRKPKVDWEKTGDGISVSLLPDKFEENYTTL